MRRFGMERIGQAIAARPRLVAAACVVVTLAAALVLSGGIAFNGDLAALLKGDTPGYRALRDIETAFHPFSRDEVLAVEAQDLGDPETYAALEGFVAELQLVDGVSAVMSVFALPAAGGGAEPFLASNEARALPPAVRLDALLERQPLAANMLAADRSASLVLVMTAATEGAAERLPPAALAEIEELAAARRPLMSVSFAGMGAIHREIERSLRSDLSLVASVSTSLCVVLALVIFRSWRGALIAAIPPIVGAGWFFGYAALAGISINAITVIIPTLLIVVGFADAVHLHFAWLRARGEGLDPRAAVRAAMAGTAPACLLTSVTTAIACLAIGVAASDALHDFAWAGFVGMFIQFVAVALMQPLLALALGGGERIVRPPFAFSGLVRAALAVLPRARPAVVVGLVLFAGFAYAQANLRNGFTLSEHLQAASPLRQLETRLVAKGLGSGQIYVTVADADGIAGVSPADRDRLAATIRAVFPDADPALADSLFPSPEQLEKLSAESEPMLRRFIARDGGRYLLPVPVDLSLPAGRIVAKVAAMRARLDAAGLGAATAIAGLPLLSATDVPQMIDDLRLGFYLALALVIAVLVYATGSWRLGAISLAPNLLPIMGVETWLWLTGQHMSMTAAVALTIAFGIAVDNSIHVLNRYQQGRVAGDDAAIANALEETAPPIAASSLLLVAGLGVTQASSLPSAAVFGQLVIAALVLALLASLFILPAFVVTFAGKGR